jgi:RimJ/RimL family protein N-acetyltransferase
MKKWAIPFVGVRFLQGIVFEGNIASIRVFEKNGFERKAFLKDTQLVYGKLRSCHVLEWRYDNPPPSLSKRQQVALHYSSSHLR